MEKYFFLFFTIFSFKKHLLNTYHIPDTFLDTKNAFMNKTMIQILYLNGRRLKWSCHLLVCKTTVSAKTAPRCPIIKFLPSFFLSYKSAHFVIFTQPITSTIKNFFHYIQSQLPQWLFLLSVLYWFLFISLTSKYGSVAGFSSHVSSWSIFMFHSVSQL